MTRKVMTKIKNDNLARFGFSFKYGSVHTKRTMMLNELCMAFDYVDEVNAESALYKRAIIDENCARKRSGVTRKYTALYLRNLYMLDPANVLFRALRYFWKRDEDSRPIIAFLTVYARDSLLRSLTPYILSLSTNQIPSKEMIELYIENKFPNRFSPGMKASLGRNLLSTWTQAGFLEGRVKKVRSTPLPTCGAVSHALFLSYLTGHRGEVLFTDQYTKVLDCSIEKAMELAQEASRKGWIVFKRVGSVIEVQFPNLLTPEEMEWIREQS